MALRQIRIQGDPVLEKSCRAITEMTPKLQTLIDDMFETMYEANGVGLAAPQVGILKRVVVIDVGDGPICMINPEIIKKDGVYDTEEGCLSLLGGPRKCKRYKTIKVQYQNLEMQTRTKNFTGWTAQIIQHEVDHCNGVLI